MVDGHCIWECNYQSWVLTVSVYQKCGDITGKWRFFLAMQRWVSYLDADPQVGTAPCPSEIHGALCVSSFQRETRISSLSDIDFAIFWGYAIEGWDYSDHMQGLMLSMLFSRIILGQIIMQHVGKSMDSCLNLPRIFMENPVGRWHFSSIFHLEED
jgi:hypothetical protein